jgi:polyhydroxybutyrate depolymerase
VIALHGAGETGSAFRSRIGLDEHADRLGWIAVYPDGIQGTWSVGCGSCTTAERLGVDDFFFLRTLVEHLDDHLAIDRDRIYVVGFSQGGMAAGWMACRGLPGLAGVGLVAAPVVATVQASCSPPSPLPVVHVHGASDPVLPWDGAGQQLPSIPTTLDLWAGVNGCGESPDVRDVAGTPGEPGAVERWDWPGCAPGSLLRLYRVEAGGHGWFGARGSQVDLDTSGALLDAFAEVAPSG